MTPEDLASRHARLYHLTAPDSFDGIKRHGLLSTSALLDLLEVGEERREAIEAQRRPAEIVLEHPVHGRAIINDNAPLSEAALASCLDDGLAPADWLRMLNARVFFWADETGLARLLCARLNHGRPREVLVIDTLSLARAHAARVELSPINSGATLRRPARRGPATFTPMSSYSYEGWSRIRGRRDEVLEVTVRDGVRDIQNHVIEVIYSPPGIPAL